MPLFNNVNLQGLGLIKLIIGLLLILALLADVGLVAGIVEHRWVEAIIILAVLFLLFGE